MNFTKREVKAEMDKWDAVSWDMDETIQELREVLYKIRYVETWGSKAQGVRERCADIESFCRDLMERCERISQHARRNSITLSKKKNRRPAK